MDATTIAKLADLIHTRNAVAEQITTLIDRPAEIGHVGEFIAAEVFDIALEESATNKGFDGRFRSGTLAGKTVDVKWYAKKEGLVDLRLEFLPDYYLVLTGPTAPPSLRGARAALGSSRQCTSLRLPAG